MPEPNHGLGVVSVIGLGYIGLPMAAILATRRVDVIGVDCNPDVVASIQQGRLHFEEPELAPVIRSVVRSGHLRAVAQPQPADIFVICVPTPFTSGHQPDLSYIQAAAQAIAPVLKRGNLVILESTSPVGTTERLADWLAAARPGLSFPATAGDDADIQLAYCPERVLPGRILQELQANDRIVGGLTPCASQQAAALYRLFVQGDCIPTTARTAEMCKLAENAYRDVNIAYANELSMICDTLDIDVQTLIRLANRHPRVNILSPGIGVGGHCIPVDPWFIVDKTPAQAQLIRTAREVNLQKTAWAVDRIRKAIRTVRERMTPEATIRVACLGLSYKPDVGDLRESPALQIVMALAGEPGLSLAAVEPHIPALPAALAGCGIAAMALQPALAWADVLVVLVGHRVFKEIGFVGREPCQVVDLVGMERAIHE